MAIPVLSFRESNRLGDRGGLADLDHNRRLSRNVRVSLEVVELEVMERIQGTLNPVARLRSDEPILAELTHRIFGTYDIA
jgi:hypothetical protein